MDYRKGLHLAYQLLNTRKIPQTVWDDACVAEKEDDIEAKKYYRMYVKSGVICLQWNLQGQLMFKGMLHAFSQYSVFI